MISKKVNADLTQNESFPTLIVISDKIQLQHLREQKILKTGTVLCDNPRFSEFMTRCGASHELIDEFCVRELWDTLNSWGCNQASSWIKLCKNASIFNSVDLASVMYHFFSRIIIQLVKYYELSKYAIDKWQPRHVFIFSTPFRAYFPNFSGNYFFNLFLRHLCQERKVKVEELTLGNVGKLDDYIPQVSSLTSRVFVALVKAAKNIMEKLCLIGLRMTDMPSLLAYGPLEHLGSTIDALKRRGEHVILYDDEYRLGTHRFAIQSGLPYLLPKGVSKVHFCDPVSWAEERMNELLRSMELSRQAGLFQYDGEDFTSFIRDHIIATMKPYLIELGKRINHYENMFDSNLFSGVLLHEDYSLQGGFLSAFSKLKKINVFCMSHANLAVDFSVSQENRAFEQSITFVNSEYEKKMYEARGWTGNEILVTGTPRYDRLCTHSQKSNFKTSNRDVEKTKLLYCAGGLWLYSADHRGYLGSGGMNRKTQLPIFQHVLKAIRDLPVELIIKPRYDSPRALWENIVKEEKSTNRIIITKHSEDIFKLYDQCAAILVPYWSTALIEAALVKIPSIFIDFDRMQRQALYDFAEHGFCRIVNNLAEIRHEIEKICRIGRRAYFDSLPRQDEEWYLGKNDGKNTMRVINSILSVNNPILSSHDLLETELLPSS